VSTKKRRQAKECAGDEKDLIAAHPPTPPPVVAVAIKVCFSRPETAAFVAFQSTFVFSANPSSGWMKLLRSAFVGEKDRGGAGRYSSREVCFQSTFIIAPKLSFSRCVTPMSAYLNYLTV